MERELTQKQVQSILSAISWMTRWVIINVDETSCLWNSGLNNPSWPTATSRLVKKHRKICGPDSPVTISIPDEIIEILREFLEHSEDEYLKREIELSFEVDGPTGGFKTLDEFKEATDFSGRKAPHNDIRTVLATLE